MKRFFIFCVYLLTTGTLYASGVKHINNQDLQQLIEKGVAIVDVRATSEWRETGVIENSHLLMFYDEKGRYDLNAWLEKIAEVANKNEPLVLICHSGSRSNQLAKYLTKVVGYEDVYNVKRGIANWIKKDHAVVKFP